MGSDDGVAPHRRENSKSRVRTVLEVCSSLLGGSYTHSVKYYLITLAIDFRIFGHFASGARVSQKRSYEIRNTAIITVSYLARSVFTGK